MEKIIDPIPLDLLLAELTPERKIMDTNRGGNVIYDVTWHNAPNVVMEIGRLREISFREAGGSSGLSADLDEFDKMESPYHQIVVWDPDAQKIIGGYRYILGPEVKFDDKGQPILATSHQFEFSEDFINHYLPHTMELGRSFVTPEYQSSKAGAKSIFALDNLWDGITAVIYERPHIHYFFGKMTMYPSLDRTARDLILHFLWKHYGDEEQLVRPWTPVMPESSPELMDIVLRSDDFKEDYKLLKEAVRLRKTSIPPLVNSYMTTSPTMKMMGTAINDLMSDVEETAILMCFEEISEDRISRHVESFRKQKLENIRKRFPLVDIEMESRIAANWESRRQKLYKEFQILREMGRKRHKKKNNK